MIWVHGAGRAEFADLEGGAGQPDRRRAAAGRAEFADLGDDGRRMIGPRKGGPFGQMRGGGAAGRGRPSQRPQAGGRRRPRRAAERGRPSPRRGLRGQACHTGAYTRGVHHPARAGRAEFAGLPDVRAGGADNCGLKPDWRLAAALALAALVARLSAFLLGARLSARLAALAFER